ncbi:MAG: SRPBCC family protein [Acidimicrobiales bacterium]
MKIAHELSVKQPPESVWSFFQQIPDVADCLPGAELTESADDGTYRGTVTTRLGPMTARFEGTARVDADPDSMSATMEGRGVDRAGGSRGGVKVNYVISPAPEGSLVQIAADISLSGAIAQFGRTGLVKEMSNRLIGEFVLCLEGKLAAGSASEAAAVKAREVRGVSLLLGSLWSWLRTLARRVFRRA